MAKTPTVAWQHFVLFYALAAGAYLFRALSNTSAPLINDTDDAMRLVGVRELLAGQAWYDHVQHRLNVPFGAELHWSRLVDAPLSALLVVLRPIFGAQAELVMLYAWPLLLLGLLLWLTARVSILLAGPEGELPGLALPALSLISMTEFAPGRIDHHSVQILLALVMLLSASLAMQRPRWAIAAGIAAGLALAIGVEAVPAIAATTLAFGLAWVLRPETAPALRRFGLSFGMTSLVLFFQHQPPQKWFIAYCDEIALPFALGALVAGGLLLALSTLRLSSAWARLIAGGVAGALTLAVLYAIAPACFRAPYASLDPWLIARWIDRIDEAKPIWTSLSTDMPYVVGVVSAPLLAGVALALGLRTANRDQQTRLLVYGLFLVTAIAVMALQVRGARLATSLAIPGAALLIAELRARFIAHKSAGNLALVTGAWFGSAGLLVGLAGALVALALPGGDKASAGELQAGLSGCRLPSSYAPLAQLEAQNVMAPVDLGSHILAFTAHAVVGAPYHRNGDGVLDTFRFFNAPIADARDIAARRGLGLLVVCPGMPELTGQPDAAADAFVRLYAGDTLPPWLVPLPMANTDLKAYRIDLSRS
jgi:hypothetical protein